MTVRILGFVQTVTRNRVRISMAKSNLVPFAPGTILRTVGMPRRRPNRELRTREHLTPDEVDRLLGAAKGNRWGHRDSTMILLAYRHGLRASELVDLRWDQVDFTRAVLHVRRVKSGTPSSHPLTGREMRVLRKLQRQIPASPFVFVSERGAPFTTAGFARMLERTAASAEIEIKVHPHMLRHACGFKLANDGHDTRSLQAYLGHKNIQHTVRYTELAPARFKNFWRD
jgi:site-specific recombinase XerD